MLLDIKNLHVSYGDAPAIWGVSLCVDAGEIVSIIGPNGAGKSTLINTIAGTLKAKSGEIWLDSVNITRIESHRVCDYGIALVPEGRRLFTKMTVADNLDLGSYRNGARAATADSLEYVYGLFPILRERRNQIAGLMSGGQQQMVAIGRALMSKPKLLLMDEPSLGLAPSIVADMFEIITTINRQGVSVLLVEQNVGQALAIADRAYVIEQGRIVTTGVPATLLQQPEIRQAYLGLA